MTSTKELGKIEGIAPIAWTFGIFPIVPLACVLITWVAGWITLGHSDLIGQVDPDSINPIISIIRAIGMIAMLCSPYLIIPGLLFVIIELLQRALHRQRDALRMIIPALLWGIALLFYIYDPGDIINWFWD